MEDGWFLPGLRRGAFVFAGLLLCECSPQMSAMSTTDPSPAIPATVAAADPIGQSGSTVSLCRPASNGGRFKETKLGELASLLRASKIKKSEFETVMELKKRTEPEITKIEKAVGGRDFIFSLPIPADRLSYDVERGTMKVGGYLGLLNTSMGDEGVIVSATQRTVGSYIGVNALGTKQKVDKLEVLELTASIPGGVSAAWPSPFTPFEITISRDEAKTANGNLSILLVGHLTPPYFRSRIGHSRPSFDIPLDINRRTETIYLDIDCAALYHRVSGRVVRNIEFSRK